MTRQSTRHLLAPELAPVLENFPQLDFSNGIGPYRGDLLAGVRAPLPPELEAVESEELFAPGLNGAPDVKIVFYRPPNLPAGPQPLVIDIHGGGFVIGDAYQMDGANRALAMHFACPVASIDYRLAPETVWPGALEDCYASLCWLHENAEKLAIDRERIVISGTSAGGGHAAALAIHARNQGGPAICFQLLDSPMLDDRTGATSDPHPYTGEFVWTPASNRFGWGAMLGMEPGGADVPDAAAPARVANLTGLPPAFIIVGTLDLFLEEDLEYTRRLARAGVPVEMHVIPGAFHGFGVAPNSPQARQAGMLKREALGRALGLGGS